MDQKQIFRFARPYPYLMQYKPGTKPESKIVDHLTKYWTSLALPNFRELSVFIRALILQAIQPLCLKRGLATQTNTGPFGKIVKMGMLLHLEHPSGYG